MSIRHVFAHGRTHPHFLSLGCDLSACTVLPVSTSAPKRVMDIEWGFHVFWERDFRGLRHPWLEKKMDCFADLPLLDCFNSQSQPGTSPADFWIAHKR